MIIYVKLLVDKNGDVCISILHEPGDDKYGYEKAAERWLPVHTVETILLSVIKQLFILECIFINCSNMKSLNKWLLIIFLLFYKLTLRFYHFTWVYEINFYCYHIKI